MMQKRLLKNTMLLYIMTAAKFILPFLITASLTRRLSQDSYGALTYITTTMNYFILLFDFGFNFSATKTISQNRENHDLVQKTISNVITAKILLVLGGFVVLLAITPFIRILSENLLLTYLYYLSIASGILLPDFLYRGIEQMEGVTLRYVISKLVAAALIIAFVWSDQFVWLVPVFYTLGNIVAIVYTALHMKQKLHYYIWVSNIRGAFAELKDSFVYFLSTFATTALTATTVFVMGIINMPSNEIAYWGVAFQIISAIQALYDPITTSVYPNVAKNKNYRMVIRLTSILTLAVAVGCVLTYFLADIAIGILAGEGYENAVPVLRWLIPILLFSFPAQMLGFPLLGALGHQKQVTCSTLISAGFQITGIVILCATEAYTLQSIALLRDASEFILMLVRIIFAILLIRSFRKTTSKNIENMV